MRTLEITQRKLEAYHDAIKEVVENETNPLRLQRRTVELARELEIVAYEEDLLELPPLEVAARFQTTVQHIKAAQEPSDLGE